MLLWSRTIPSCFILLFGYTQSKAVLENNGYTDFVVAISPDVSQDQDTISNIQIMMREMSRELYIATRKRAYLRTVKILLPKTWNYPDAQPIENESYDLAEFRIDNQNAAYGDSPYTVQTTECGVPGTYTHLTPGYVKDGSIWGNKGKTLVHEFAKLRWGVFEEHGYPGDKKFPMFYLKTEWSMSGQKTSVTPNFCVNSELRGYEQDVTDGGACRADSSGSGLPDGNCIFYATQDSKPTSSYMALPYLTTNINFCDDTEALLHEPNLPNKQNLYCSGRSTWAVIQDSEDFANGNNPSNPTITNTDPEFIILGGEGHVTSYVLVMDVSKSMEEKNRFIPMKNAAKRWITYDVEDNTPVGIIFFGDNAIYGSDMTAINETSRTNLSKIIDDVPAQGRTCITIGLYEAMYNKGLLNNSTGNVIILLTDGAQNCPIPGAPPISDMIPRLVQNKIRVITIAIGDDADPEIEDLAEKTGGKSYFVEDNSGPGDFNDAFSGSTTNQPGDTLGNTEMTIYQHDWPANSTELKGVFEIDNTIGKDLKFQLEIVKSRSASGNCREPFLIKVYNPDLQVIIDQKFTCTTDNFGIYLYQFKDTAVAGKWQYWLTTKETYDSVSVKITSKSRDDNVDPIQTRCWINTGSQSLDSEVDLKLSAMAEVKQGNMPVLGAKVIAYIERPEETAGVPQPPLELELMDNGAGADSIQNDGIYTRYFTHYTGKGRYSVKCQVEGNDDTQINEGFIVDRALPEKTGTPMCCGSNTILPTTRLSNTGNFTRQSSGGSFQIKSSITGEDRTPPARVLDLQGSCSGPDLTFTAPGDDLDSNEPAKSYTIKFALTAGNLTGNLFESGNNTVLDSSYISSGVLNPVNGGSQVKLTLKREKFDLSNLYFFAMKATDEAGNESPGSNIVSTVLTCANTTTTTTTTTPSSGHTLINGFNLLPVLSSFVLYFHK